MSVAAWILWIVGGIVVFLLIQVIYLFAVLDWGERRTLGLAYYGLPREERAAFRDRLRLHARLLAPILRLVGRASTLRFERASFRHDGLPGPRGTCSETSFANARAYGPAAEDVFVVTQMKCGTTWMQNVVYEVLARGRGDLVDTGRALYGISPWLEALKCVSVEDAPLLGDERPSRIIKTHLPVTHCPESPDARYIYVARHPISCFASCVDFISENSGPMAPPIDEIEAWYCSEDMWWGPWTEHVAGWWSRSVAAANVLFVRFEDMKLDLRDVVERVAAFLGVPPLDEAEMAAVLRKCGFEYMSANGDIFEMHPPHIFATNAALFVKGTADRHRDVPLEARRRIAGWCAETLAATPYPLADQYPDVTAGES